MVKINIYRYIVRAGLLVENAYILGALSSEFAKEQSDWHSYLQRTV